MSLTNWIPPLEDHIRQTFAANTPMVGICFGHQIMAQALGGRVEKFSGGWSVGVKDYAIDEIWATTFGSMPGTRIKSSPHRYRRLSPDHLHSVVTPRFATATGAFRSSLTRSSPPTS